MSPRADGLTNTARVFARHRTPVGRTGPFPREPEVKVRTGQRLPGAGSAPAVATASLASGKLVRKTGHTSRQADQAGQGNGPGGRGLTAGEGAALCGRHPPRFPAGLHSRYPRPGLGCSPPAPARHPPGASTLRRGGFVDDKRVWGSSGLGLDALVGSGTPGRGSFPPWASIRSLSPTLVRKTDHASRQVDQAGQGEGAGEGALTAGLFFFALSGGWGSRSWRGKNSPCRRELGG
jgi:hypothetical protein